MVLYKIPIKKFDLLYKLLKVGEKRWQIFYFGCF